MAATPSVYFLALGGEILHNSFFFSLDFHEYLWHSFPQHTFPNFILCRLQVSKELQARFPIHKALNSCCDALPFRFPKLSVLNHKVLTRLPSLVITYDAQ